MSNYKEFKHDVNRIAISFTLASFIIWIFKALLFIITFGVITISNKIENKKTENKNTYKI
jgi:hypothetical protein